MPIRQPVQTTIRADDFHDKAFSFLVESIVAPEWITGNLVINAPEGYLITTSLTNEPKQKQAIPYRKHPNGQWVAEETVTLLFTGDFPTDGKVIIHNSLDERVILTIDITSPPIKKPELTVSDQALTINQSSADKPGFGLLTIAQQHTNTPVTITTDLPEFFLLASDSQPTFRPSLLIIPSAAGTYVHVRYYANKRGRHTGQLLIDAPYDSKTVALEGQRMGLLPILQTGRAVVKPASSEEVPARKRWIPIVLAGLSASLALVGYHYRCQLYPGLCQEKTTQQAVIPADSLRLAPSMAEDSLKTELAKEMDKPVKLPVPVVKSDSAIAPNEVSTTVQEPRSQTTSADVLAEQRIAEPTQPTPKSVNKQTVDNQLKTRVKRRQDSTSTEEESELEKALNPPD